MHVFIIFKDALNSTLQLVKDIRRLVDNGEFLANKHCNSPVFKLIVTLLLELITDYSREVSLSIQTAAMLPGLASIDPSLSPPTLHACSS